MRIGNECEMYCKEYELDKVHPLTRPITEMDALTLNYWLSTFVKRWQSAPKIHTLQKRLPDCVWHSLIHGGKEPSRPVQSLGLFGQKVREWALLERGAV